MYKILMLEDDMFLLFQYAESLKDNGFYVDYTTNIEEFYSSAINSEYDAIVCDINLPANNFLSDIETMGGWRTGLAICKKIRLNGSDAKLIALTNSMLPEAVEWFSQDESVAYCNKRYFPPLEFAIALKSILDNPDYTFGELEETDTLHYHLLYSRNQLPDTQDEIINKLDKIIESLNSNDNKSFKSSLIDFISLSANISGVLTALPTIKELLSILQTLI